MGQYYNALIFKGKRYNSYSLETKNRFSGNEYTMHKLTEHSWFNNSAVNSIANLLFENPQNIAWVGDYADDVKNFEINNPELNVEQVKYLYKKTYSDKVREKTVEYRPLFIQYMILVNWTKKEYLIISDYKKRNTKNGWCLHPLPLLTALGNGQGGGDYWGTNMKYIGYWAFDIISFEHHNCIDYLKEHQFKEMKFNFREK